jgi:hypothetical protein
MFQIVANPRRCVANEVFNMSDDSLESMVYTGPSMNPTLKTLDRIQVIPYNGRKIRAGDVIVFLASGYDRKVAHRVISAGSKGIRTRGDNDIKIDLWVLSPDDIFGRVVYAQRRNRRLRIYGGPVGRLFAYAVRTIHIIDHRISSLLHPVYHWLAQLSVFRQLLPANMKTRVFSFNRPAGTELQLLMGRRVIGRLLPGKDQWQIQRPFRLFVDEASLPKAALDNITTLHVTIPSPIIGQ